MVCFLFRFSSNSMGDDGTMAKGTRYTPEFRAKAVRLLAESRSSYSSETKRSAQEAMAELKRLRAENTELRRAKEISTTAPAFFAAGLDPTRR